MREPLEQQQHFPSVSVCGEPVDASAHEAGQTPESHLPARSTAVPPAHWDSRRVLCWGWEVGSPAGRRGGLRRWPRRAPGRCEFGTEGGGRLTAGRHGKWREPAQVAGADLVFWARLRSPHQPLPFPRVPAAPPKPVAAAPPTGHAERWGGTPVDGRMHCSDSHRLHEDAPQVRLGSWFQMLESIEQKKYIY